MHGKVKRGLDYTPLFRFLLAKVGMPWNEIHPEAIARLDRSERFLDRGAAGAGTERIRSGR